MEYKSKNHKYRLQWHNRMGAIDQKQWDRLALPVKSPFLEWSWLDLMEKSGSIAVNTGWVPNHLTIFKGTRLVAAAPLYIKLHSEGEFVQDYAWAQAAAAIGINYYPKMIGACPVTPVAGYRFLIDPEFDEQKMTKLMLEKIDEFCLNHRLSSCNFLFADRSWKTLLEHLNRHAWAHQSFIWKNRGFTSFEDYLALFKTNQRRNIRRERKSMEKQGLTLKAHVGGEIPDRLFSVMFDFYARTNDKFGPWGCKYLTNEFFEGLHERYRHRLLLVAAYHESKMESPEGMSLLVVKDDKLYGRYWGCYKKYNALHFNACYYFPIQWAIENGIREFNPGAGGGHKIRRGFLSTPSYSLLKFYNPRLQNIMLRNIERINRMELEEMDIINRRIPFAHSTADN